MGFACATSIVRGASVAFEPPILVSPAEGAQRVFRIRQSTGELKKWSPDATPYMVEPLNTTSSAVHNGLCFVGPARSGKTAALGDGWLGHSICHDVGDTLIVQMTQGKARDYSITRISRMIRNSPEIRSRMSSRSKHDNTFDKLTKTGNYIKIGWPSANELASSDFVRVFWTEYDRCPDDIDGEGSGFVLASKRVQQAMSRGMAAFECSPSRDIEDPHWKPSTPHEAPPVTGILGIYNNSDRRRWYWQCLDCHEYFEASPGLKLFFSLPSDDDLLEIVRTEDLSSLAKEHANIACPHCGSVYGHDKKRILNDINTARWVGEGQSVNTDGELIGDLKKSSIAGFWLGGVAAAYQSWESILLGHLQGLREYAASGSESTLKSKTNVDQAMPYLPRHLAEEDTVSVESRQEKMERFFVPEWTRFLLAAVDVQGGQKARFVVQVHAIGVDMESAIVDRYDIIDSPRGDNIRIDPAAYPEDWVVLTNRVVNSTYRIDDENELRVLHTVVDYGGEAGVSQQAADWYQKIRIAKLHNRVTLSKGDGKMEKPVQKTHARDKNGKKMMRVPLLLFATNHFKDMVSSSLRRTESGPGFMHFPTWLKSWFFDELRAEIREANGKWKKVRARNEALDLWCMIWALAFFLKPADTRKNFNWQNPPAWAKPLSENSEVITKDERRALKKGQPKKKNKANHGFGSEDWNL